MYVANVRSEFGYVSHLSQHTRRMTATVRAQRTESVHKWFVVSEYAELPALYEMTEMLNRQIGRDLDKV